MVTDLCHIVFSADGAQDEAHRNNKVAVCRAFTFRLAGRKGKNARYQDDSRHIVWQNTTHMQAVFSLSVCPMSLRFRLAERKVVNVNTRQRFTFSHFRPASRRLESQFSCGVAKRQKIEKFKLLHNEHVKYYKSLR